jgi:ring-1,2-phenylacetyl-CoA epoxidase subunit PaaE
MMLAIAASLRDHGLTDAQIKFELFASSQPGRAKARPVSTADLTAGNVTAATATLDGTTRSFQMPRQGQSILDAAIAAALDAPYSCKAGVCSTCRCKVLEGEVEMVTNHALEDYEVRAGYVLSCQSFPMTDKVVVTFDE